MWLHVRHDCSGVIRIFIDGHAFDLSGLFAIYYFVVCMERVLLTLRFSCM